MEKKNNTWIIVLLVLIILGLVGYICFDKWAKKNEEQNTDVQNAMKAYKIELPEMDVPKTLCGQSEFPFEGKNLEASDLSAEIKLQLLETVYEQLIPEEFRLGGYYGDTYGEDEIKNSYELDFDILSLASKYFDVTPELERNIKEGFYGNNYHFRYLNNKSYIYTLVGGCVLGDGESGDFVVLKDKTIHDNILIKSYYYYYQKLIYNSEDDLTLNIYKNAEDNTPVYSRNIRDKSKLDLNGFDTYDFYYDISNGNMKLIKVIYNKGKRQ